VRALVAGTMGGAVHGYGKILSPDRGLVGIAVGHLGASLVANAGRGTSVVDELVVPLGPARIRMTARASRKIGVTLNAFESAIVVHRALQPGVRIDWGRSAATGTLVLRTAAPLIVTEGRRAAGLTAGSVITLSDQAMNLARSLDHERIHVQQEWFIQEVWGRPVENGARGHAALRWVPAWLDLGIVTPALTTLERQTIGVNAPLRSWREAEAEALEDQSRP
jgi:hypothetical protein